MIVKIAAKGNFYLERNTYIGEHEYNTHEISITKKEISNVFNDETTYTIASFNDEGELVSCGDRLLEIPAEEFDDIKTLAKIGSLIIRETKASKTDYKTPNKVRHSDGIIEIFNED